MLAKFFTYDQPEVATIRVTPFREFMGFELVSIDKWTDSVHNPSIAALIDGVAWPLITPAQFAEDGARLKFVLESRQIATPADYLKWRNQLTAEQVAGNQALPPRSEAEYFEMAELWDAAKIRVMERRKAQQAERDAKDEERRRAEVERAEQAFQRDKERYIAGEFVSGNTFLEIAKFYGADIAIRTIGTIRKRVSSVSRTSGIKVAGARTGLDGCFKLVHLVNALIDEAQQPKETVSPEVEALFKAAMREVA